MSGARDNGVANLSLCVCHRPPLGGCQNALLGSLGFVAKDVSNETRVGPNFLQEHEVGGEGLLGCVGVLDVALTRLARLALGSAEEVLALDVLGSERAHVRFVFLLPSLLHRLGATLVRLHPLSENYGAKHVIDVPLSQQS